MKTITSIEPQKKYKNRYNLYIDGCFYMGINEDIIIKNFLSVGMEVSDDFIEDIIRTEEYSKAFNSAINKLSFRARSKREIEKILQEKGYDGDIIKSTIQKLEKYQYLDDVAFATAFIKDKQNFKKAGKGLLKQELYYKGVDKKIINRLLTENITDEGEYERALELAQNKNLSFRTKDDKNSRYRKLSGLLARKGYSFDIISKVIKRVLYLNEEDF